MPDQAMSNVVGQLAELTTLRDRDLLDTTLAAALRDILRPQQVAIYRCVGEEIERRWLMRARLRLHDLAAASDPPWAELAQLPTLDAFPARLQALREQQVVVQAGPPQLSVFPLTTDRDVAGVLEITTDQPLDSTDHRLVGGILRIYRNFQGLLDYSERDTLTGLLNRKTFDEAFSKLGSSFSPPQLDVTGVAGEQSGEQGGAHADPATLALGGLGRRSALGSQPRYIGVIDIDHFKRVNDQHGHLIGDEVLLLLSRLMRSVFRFHDQLFRFGGEEFVVLMRCHGEADAGVALERLRSSVKAFAFPQVGSISVSAGYSQVLPGDTPASAFERADRAVYWAKAHGRDQVCSHAALVARGDLLDQAKVSDVELF